MCQSHSTSAWIVLCPIIPGTRHWRGLKCTVVAEPYAVLTTVQNYRLVQPHNSVWGPHYCAMGATRTQASTLLVLLVLMMLALRPQVQVYVHGRLELGIRPLRQPQQCSCRAVMQPQHASTSTLQTGSHRCPANPCVLQAHCWSLLVF